MPNRGASPAACSSFERRAWGGCEGQGRGSPPLPEDLPLKLTSSGRAIADDMNSFKMSGLRQQDLVVIREELAWVAKQPRVL